MVQLKQVMTMAENSKLKILYILDIMKKTDALHPLNTTQIAEKLLNYGIKAERKSIGRDLECLEDAGYSIVKCENHNQGWYMTDLDFEDHELKMLVDAVASAKFLTIQESRAMIKKIKNLATKEGERLIDATTVMDPAMKIADSKFKFKFDLVMRAIAEKKQIRFQYYELTSGNQRRLKRDGYVYQISPYYIVLVNNEEYFVVGNPVTHDHTAHFRIEMMTNAEVMDEKVRPMQEIVELKEIGNTKTIGDYIRETVNMWSGESTKVTLRCGNGCRHNLMVKFGKDITMRDEDVDTFIAYVNVANNEGFYQWLAAYGPHITIEAPKNMRQHYIEYLKKTLACYEKADDNYETQ